MKNSKISLALAMALVYYGGGELLATESQSKTETNMTDSTANLYKDSAQNINQNIILAQNDNQTIDTDSNQNTNSTESNAESTPSLLDKVLGIGDTARGKSDTYDLGNIERVVGGADENTTVEIISSETMEQEGAKDMAHALRFTPGIFYMPNNNGKSTVYIRGFGEEDTGFYFDGIPINDIYDGNAAGATDLSPFVTFGLGEIQISKGYTSPIFSSGKMGGALNMVTSKPKDKLEIRAGYTFIANNEHRANTQVGSNWGNQYFQLTYSYMQRKSLNLAYDYSGEGPVAISNSSYKNNFVTGKYGFTPNGNHEYSLNFYFQNAKRLPTLPFYDKTAFYILGHSQFNKLVSLDSKLWYHMNDNQSGNTIGWSSLYTDYSLGITESVKLDFSDDQNLKVGFTVKNDNHKAVDVGVSWAKRNWHLLNSSIFAEYALRVNDIFRFVLSGSYDRQDGLKVQNKTTTATTNNANKHLQGFTLQGIGYVSLGEYWLIHANVGHKANMPKFRTLYGNYTTNLAPNEKLTNESLVNAELGATFDWGSGQISATVFYNYIHNKIITAWVDANLCANPSGNAPNQYCVRYENAKDGYSVGAEASIRQGFWDDKLVLGANWTYTHRVTNQYSRGNKTGSREFTTHPRQNINFNILFAPLKQFDINLMGSVQTSRWAYRSNYEDYVSLPTVFYFDLVANYYVTNTFKLTFGAYNLFDRNYNYSSSTTGRNSAFVGGLPGRRVFAGFEYRF